MRSLATIIALAWVSACVLAGCIGPGPHSDDGSDSDRPDCLQDPAEAFDLFFDETWPPFCESAYGNGSFGQWSTDTERRPVYVYTMNQSVDPRAQYTVSQGTSRDHWHLIGNDRIGATAHNGSYVQFYDWSRGGKILNRWSPQECNFTGGFKFIRVNGQTFNTLWEHLPEGAQTRAFGMGYFEKQTRLADLVVTERIEAPLGNDPVLVSTTKVKNTSTNPMDLVLVEFWDVNIQQLLAALVMTHGLGEIAQEKRRQFNSRFVMDSFFEESSQVLGVEFQPVEPGEVPGYNDIAEGDFHLKTVFLAALDTLPVAFDRFAVDQEMFFTNAGLADPPGVLGSADGYLFLDRPALGGQAILAFRRQVALSPGQEATLRYLFGYAGREDIPDLVGTYREDRDRGRVPVVEFVAPDMPWLGRELEWHSYYLQAGSYYQEFYDSFFVDQGSAYSYLQGMSGAHRDFALFGLPLVYLRPDLAKEMLRFAMRSQIAEDGELPYMHFGYGMVSGAVIHQASSDLDLFFLWALAEYLSATGDLGFLQEDVLFYPPSAGVLGTVLDHARAAYCHLTHAIGLGPHGLIRCGSGDWNDVLIAYSDRPLATMLWGESALNAGLAAMALPLLADILESTDPGFAASMRDLAASQARALQPLWAGDWVARGYLGHGDAMLGQDRLFLDAQAFSVLGGVWDPQMTRCLFERIRTDCAAPQSVGALSLWPPYEGPLLEPGSDTNGGTWAAIDSWVAWAWSLTDPAMAWNFFLSTTLAAHAQAYPNLWYGIWSGPDSFNAHYHQRPGETFNFAFTPMTDFPVMNMNRHSGPLLDAIKLAGIEPRHGSIVVDPHLPFPTFALRTPLVGVAYLEDRHRGYYRPQFSGTFSFAVRAPVALDLPDISLEVNGAAHHFSVDSRGLVCFDAFGSVEEPIVWEIN